MNELRTFDPIVDPFALDPLEDSLRSLLRPWRFDMPDAAPRIRLALSGQDGTYAVKAEFPGVNKGDIDVRLDGNMVTISAGIKTETDEKDQGGRMLRDERQEGYATRSFTLACPVGEGNVQVSDQNGILALTLPKKAATSSKRIAIR